jgi:hypothetical protein
MAVKRGRSRRRKSMKSERTILLRQSVGHCSAQIDGLISLANASESSPLRKEVLNKAKTYFLTAVSLLKLMPSDGVESSTTNLHGEDQLTTKLIERFDSILDELSDSGDILSMLRAVIDELDGDTEEGQSNHLLLACFDKLNAKLACSTSTIHFYNRVPPLLHRGMDPSVVLTTLFHLCRDATSLPQLAKLLKHHGFTNTTTSHRDSLRDHSPSYSEIVKGWESQLLQLKDISQFSTLAEGFVESFNACAFCE